MGRSRHPVSGGGLWSLRLVLGARRSGVPRLRLVLGALLGGGVPRRRRFLGALLGLLLAVLAVDLLEEAIHLGLFLSRRWSSEHLFDNTSNRSAWYSKSMENIPVLGIATGGVAQNIIFTA